MTVPNLPGQTHIADADCLDCGKEVKVKLNKNGKAYFYCNHVHVGTGNFCGAHHRWGKDRSQAMQQEYLAARKNSQQPEEQLNDFEDRNTPAQLSEQPDASTDVGDGAGADTLADRSEDTGSGSGWGLFG